MLDGEDLLNEEGRAAGSSSREQPTQADYIQNNIETIMTKISTDAGMKISMFWCD